MINTALSVLKEKLNEYFRIKTEVDSDLVKFIESNGSDPVSFTNNAVTPFLINVSEDRKFRNPDQFSGVTRDGIRTQANPEIRIELLVLFVSKFSDYDQALNFLSFVIKFFQAHRIFTPKNSPALADEKNRKARHGAGITSARGTKPGMALFKYILPSFRAIQDTSHSLY